MKSKFELGKRYLIIDIFTLLAYRGMVEVTVLEISPSGKYVKFLFPSKLEVWERVSDYEIKEVLE